MRVARMPIVSVAVAATGLVGCLQVPGYLTPAGYSSSYRRHVDHFDEHVIVPAAHMTRITERATPRPVIVAPGPMPVESSPSTPATRSVPRPEADSAPEPDGDPGEPKTDAGPVAEGDRVPPPSPAAARSNVGAEVPPPPPPTAKRSVRSPLSDVADRPRSPADSL